ncbi:alpha-ketoglutarate-dependent dioxygenase AlkB [Acinetobacter variabilis]|uniref:alpha-ketoglutarate-dependent dioxygenase AlkB family protein n=1 Tax=Acinetobacter variabilis TaxID=70346 RepID=UPI003A89CEC6
MMLDLFEFPKNEVSGIKFFKNHYPIHYSENGKEFRIELPQGELIYIPKFIEKRIADRTLDVVFENDSYDWKTTDWQNIENFDAITWQNIAWKQDQIKMYGKELSLPRVSAWYGDSGMDYTYSGIKLKANPWIPALIWLKQQLEQVSATEFNSVLLNWYRDGQDHISWHTDAEKELGRNPTIASLNFGESRRFLLRENNDHDNKIEISLGHGDLLVMKGALQHHWQHSVPKQTKVSSGRLNMTFRKISLEI